MRLNVCKPFTSYISHGTYCIAGLNVYVRVLYILQQLKRWNRPNFSVTYGVRDCFQVPSKAILLHLHKIINVFMPTFRQTAKVLNNLSWNLSLKAITQRALLIMKKCWFLQRMFACFLPHSTKEREKKKVHLVCSEDSVVSESWVQKEKAFSSKITFATDSKATTKCSPQSTCKSGEFLFSRKSRKPLFHPEPKGSIYNWKKCTSNPCFFLIWWNWDLICSADLSFCLSTD